MTEKSGNWQSRHGAACRSHVTRWQPQTDCWRTQRHADSRDRGRYACAHVTWKRVGMWTATMRTADIDTEIVCFRCFQAPGPLRTQGKRLLSVLSFRFQAGKSLIRLSVIFYYRWRPLRRDDGGGGEFHQRWNSLTNFSYFDGNVFNTEQELLPQNSSIDYYDNKDSLSVFSVP